MTIYLQTSWKPSDLADTLCSAQRQLPEMNCTLQFYSDCQSLIERLVEQLKRSDLEIIIATVQHSELPENCCASSDILDVVEKLGRFPREVRRSFDDMLRAVLFDLSVQYGIQLSAALDTICDCGCKKSRAAANEYKQLFVLLRQHQAGEIVISNYSTLLKTATLGVEKFIAQNCELMPQPQCYRQLCRECARCREIQVVIAR